MIHFNMNIESNNTFSRVLYSIVACYLCHRITAEDMEELKQIGTSFAAETNQRDEDAEM